MPMPAIHRSFSLRIPTFAMPSSSSSSSSASHHSGNRNSVVSDAASSSSSSGSGSGSAAQTSANNSQRSSRHIDATPTTATTTGGYSPDDERSPTTPTASVQYSNSAPITRDNSVSHQQNPHQNTYQAPPQPAPTPAPAPPRKEPPAYVSNGIAQPIISSHERDASLSTIPLADSLRDSAYVLHSSAIGFNDPFPSPLTPNAATFLINANCNGNNGNNNRNSNMSMSNGHMDSRHASKDYRFSMASSLYYDNYDSTSLYTVDSKVDEDAFQSLAPRPGVHQSDSSSGRSSRRTSNDDGEYDDEDGWDTEREDRFSLSDVGEAYRNQILLGGGGSPEASPQLDKDMSIEAGKHWDKAKDKGRDKNENNNDNDDDLYANGNVPLRASTPTQESIKENGGPSGAGGPSTAAETNGVSNGNNRQSQRQSVGLWQREESMEILREEVWRLMTVVEEEVAKRERMKAEMKTFKQVMYHNTKALIKNSHVDLNKGYMRIHPLLNDEGRFPDPVIFPLTVGALMKLNDATLTSLIVFYGLQQTDMQYYSKFSALRDHLGIDP